VAQIAIFVTVDESGGFYDSGFIQPVDFFGTGPRIPLLAISPSPQAVMSATFIASIPLSSNSLKRNWMLSGAAQRSQPRQFAESDTGRRNLRAGQHAGHRRFV